jgi:aldose sugar dehydrogenase
MKPHWPLGPILLAWLSVASCAPQPDSLERTREVPEASGWRLETLIAGLEHPWSIAWLPDGSALVTERPGRLRRIRDGRLDPVPIAGLPPVLAEGQGGLLDIAPHPRFAENKLVYFTFSVGTEAANRTALGRGRLASGRLDDVEIVFRNPESKSGLQHFGSRLLWLPDGALLMSIGDGGNPPIALRGQPIRMQAQNPGTDFGKTLRLDENGRPVPGNPLGKTPGARPEVWTLGHRNIQGLARDPQSGRIWATEHGSRGGDELNVIAGGSNYGWPVASFSMEYSGPPVAEQTSRPGMVDPLLVWTPSIAPSGLVFYTGSEFPNWQGDLLAGSLKLGELHRIDLEGDRILGEEKLKIGARVRDVRQGPDGGLYVLTDEPQGRLLRIRPAAGPTAHR